MDAAHLAKVTGWAAPALIWVDPLWSSMFTGSQTSIDRRCVRTVSDDPISRGQRAADAQPSKGHLVAEITVRQLFGKYSYRVSSLTPKEARRGGPPMLLLYGDNGSGKTTILRLLWNLFSPAPNKGHRTQISNTPFRQFQVRLGNGDVVTVDKIDDLIGSFEITVKRGTRIIVKSRYEWESGKIPPRLGRSQTIDEETYRLLTREHVMVSESDLFDKRNGDEFVDYLRSLEKVPILLADDRRMHFDEGPRVRRRGAPREIDEIQTEQSQLAVEVQAVVRRTNDWLRDRVFIGAEAGSEGVEDVYREVARNLSRANSSEPSIPPDVLSSRLREVESRANRFSEFGIFPRFDSTAFTRILQRASGERAAIVASVLGPYVRSQNARLDQLEAIEQTLRSFVANLNRYLNGKQVTFTVQRGLRIVDPDQGELTSIQLSSGERQLLLLMCNALLARETTNVFLADEPELSLNAKWQRSIVDSLLDCVRGSEVQFILATHSIEIISRHRQALAQLEVQL
jgi:ABC-type lipoprotein export system ATPase subunit